MRTGDIGRLDEDGFLYLVDRKKDMILSGGQNIYPADIEATIIEHDAVHEVAVVGVASRKWGETPLAVVVVAEGQSIDNDELMAWSNVAVMSVDGGASCELACGLSAAMPVSGRRYSSVSSKSWRCRRRRV